MTTMHAEQGLAIRSTSPFPPRCILGSIWVRCVDQAGGMTAQFVPTSTMQAISMQAEPAGHPSLEVQVPQSPSGNSVQKAGNTVFTEPEQTRPSAHSLPPVMGSKVHFRAQTWWTQMPLAPQAAPSTAGRHVPLTQVSHAAHAGHFFFFFLCFLRLASTSVVASPALIPRAASTPRLRRRVRRLVSRCVTTSNWGASMDISPIWQSKLECSIAAGGRMHIRRNTDFRDKWGRSECR